MYKVLLASGCSFTHGDNTWPNHLSEYLNIDLVNVGMGSMGNTLIARRAIAELSTLLQSYRPEEILVGIMWSGTNRIHRYIGPVPQLSNTCEWVENPTNLWSDGPKTWEISNNHWDTEFAKNYIKYIHTFEDSMMNTLDSILLTQNYFNSHKVGYFMSSIFNFYTDLNTMPDEIVKYSKLVDYTKFADLGGCAEWCVANQIDSEYIAIKQDWLEHPEREGYKEYTKQVLLPFLKNIKINNTI